MAQRGHPLSRSGMLHLGVVYIVWSSTYLAIRVAVRPASGFPPFMMCTSRMALAALLLFGIAFLRKERLRPARDEVARLVLTGMLLWLGGNGLVIWAAQYADSGFTALVVSTTPIWVALLEMGLFKKAARLQLFASLALGFLGLAVLMLPALRRGNFTELAPGLALVGAAISWALGSIYQNRHPVRLSSLTTAAYQHGVACAGFLIVALLTREPLPTPTDNALLAWIYLIVFGSLAFASFVSALKLLPINIAMTYAYVNPVLALILGWWLLGETITGRTVAGAILVIISVVGIFREQYRT